MYHARDVTMMMGGVFALDGRNIATLGAVAVLLGIGYLLVPDQIMQYGAWLVVFAVWMVWFVLTAVAWLSEVDF